jgi:predicted phosphodiesterase
MKIAHISDIHIDNAVFPDRMVQFEALLVNIFEIGYDHVIITGDLTDVADEDDMWQIRNMFERNGLLDWKKMTLIPGNHDLFGKFEFNPERVVNNAVNASGINSLRKLKVFCEIFRDVMTPENYANYYFPFVKIFDEEKIAIVAFNSVFEFSLANNPIGSRGYIREQEMEAMLEADILDMLKDKFVIAITHHGYNVITPKTPYEQAYVWTMELINRDAYVGALEKMNAKLALHGHVHKTEVYDVNNIRFMNAGAFKRSRSIINSITVQPDHSYEQAFIKYHELVTV